LSRFNPLTAGIGHVVYSVEMKGRVTTYTGQPRTLAQLEYDVPEPEPGGGREAATAHEHGNRVRLGLEP
jgi:hypothetical protein